MDKLKILFQQVFMISTGTLFMTGINGAISYLTGTAFYFPWYFPFAIILLGFLCALPTFLFILKDRGKQKRFILNLTLHCLSIWAITSIMGWILKWYSSLHEFLIITAEYIGVYIFVWVASMWSLRSDDKKINQALTDIQDEE